MDYAPVSQVCMVPCFGSEVMMQVARCLAECNTKLQIIHIELELGQLSHYTNRATCWMEWGVMFGRGKQYHS